MTKNESSGYIYIYETNGRYKIGRTIRPFYKRINEQDKISGEKTLIFAKHTKFNIRIENFIHQLFNYCRLKSIESNELFLLSP